MTPPMFPTCARASPIEPSARIAQKTSARLTLPLLRSRSSLFSILQRPQKEVTLHSPRAPLPPGPPDPPPPPPPDGAVPATPPPVFPVPPAPANVDAPPLMG